MEVEEMEAVVYNWTGGFGLSWLLQLLEYVYMSLWWSTNATIKCVIQKYQSMTPDCLNIDVCYKCQRNTGNLILPQKFLREVKSVAVTTRRGVQHEIQSETKG